MRQLDLCSGVGAGFGIAGLRAGWELVGICENDNYCTDILSKRFPGYPERVVRYPAELARPLGVPSGNGTIRKQR
jgi:site-specific DNA-cytosine methylase